MDKNAWIQEKEPKGNTAFEYSVYEGPNEVMHVKGNKAKDYVLIDTGPYRIRYKVLCGSAEDVVCFDKEGVVIIKTRCADVLVASEYDEYLIPSEAPYRSDYVTRSSERDRI